MIESCLRAALLASAHVVALVVDRISPQPLPQAETLPAVTVKKISDIPIARSQRGRSGLSDARLQVDAWAATLLEAQGVADSICDLLDPSWNDPMAHRAPGVPLYIGAGSRMDWARVMNQQDFDEPDVQDAGDPAIRYHRVSTDFLVRYARES